MTTLFPDNYVHLGGDEVDRSCWLEDREMQARLARFIDADGHAPRLHRLTDFFWQRAYRWMHRFGRAVINW